MEVAGAFRAVKQDAVSEPKVLAASAEAIAAALYSKKSSSFTAARVADLFGSVKAKRR